MQIPTFLMGLIYGGERRRLIPTDTIYKQPKGSILRPIAYLTEFN
jgi:hypothetical protein